MKSRCYWLRADWARRLLIIIFLCGMHMQTGVGIAEPAAADRVRYAEIRRLIKKNRHFSGHLTLAVDTRTIKEVRRHIGERDITVLVWMMGDKDYGVASAASGLLVTLGSKARPALLEAARGKDYAIAGQARDALQLLEVCYSQARESRNADVCPTDS